MELDTFCHAYALCEDMLRAIHEEADGRYSAPYEPSFRAYKALDTQLEPFVLVAYDEDNPVGLLGVTVIDSIHERFSCALNDVFYIRPEYRSSLLCGTMVREAERIARDRGIDKFSWNVPPGSPLDVTFRKRKEYVPESVSYVKSLTNKEPDP